MRNGSTGLRHISRYSKGEQNNEKVVQHSSEQIERLVQKVEALQAMVKDLKSGQ